MYQNVIPQTIFILQKNLNPICMIYLATLTCSFQHIQQMRRQLRHSTILCTYISTHVHAYAMSLGNGLASEDGGHERASERVASANGVGNLHLRGLKIRHGSLREYIAAVDATGKHEHVEVVLAEDEPALVLEIHPWIAKHPTDNDEPLALSDARI